MFDPKGSHLLDEQLAVSGLEMSIVITAPLALAGVSAAANIAGGIFGARSASKSNSKAKSNRKKQKRHVK